MVSALQDIEINLIRALRDGGWPTLLKTGISSDRLLNLDGNKGFVISSSLNGLLGSALSGGKDIGGDGAPDIVVGEPDLSYYSANLRWDAGLMINCCCKLSLRQQSKKGYAGPMAINSKARSALLPSPLPVLKFALEVSTARTTALSVV